MINRLRCFLFSPSPRLPVPPSILLAALLCVSGATFAADPVTKPRWAKEDVVTMRGRLVGGRLISDRMAYLFQPASPGDVPEFINQEIEVRGWYGMNRTVLTFQAAQKPRIVVPRHWSVPFIVLLACIACFPFINKHFWEHHYHHIALSLGLVVVVFYLALLGGYGKHRLEEMFIEYFQFIALIGSLYVVTGGILIDISGEGRPWLNTLILGVGALLANVFGTTGASALLIRPFLRINKDRLRPFHVVFFIFIVANCGGALTPIGDPPLFLGYLNNVPFFWTVKNCAPAWVLVICVLLWTFFLFDSAAAPRSTSNVRPSVKVSGALNFFCLGIVIFAVFLDKILHEKVTTAFEGYPIGACVMLLAAIVAYRGSKRENLERNEFTFGPIKEVGWLFAGIFATMVPALDYLSVNAGSLQVKTPGAFYFASGALSSVLDNAPTYLTFLAAALGSYDMTMEHDMPRFIAEHGKHLLAISLGSVFFGACTYIGNGPNFMIKAIAEASGAPTPGFFGYIIKYTGILLIVYTVVWAAFLR
jgi:Na+/H+ antiporter NhaD/arsenite permease-like protein